VPISRRKRAADHLQNAHDLARAAVGCMGGLDGAALIATGFRLLWR
jgi:hypothetical protein